MIPADSGVRVDRAMTAVPTIEKQWVAEMIPADSGFRVDWAMTAVPSGTCSGPMLWDVFGTHVVGRVRGQFSSITCANFQ